MRILAEITIERDEQSEGQSLYYTKNAWILHFGLEFQIIDTANGPVPVNYTVVITEDYETGQVESYLPNQIRILGKQMKP